MTVYKNNISKLFTKTYFWLFFVLFFFFSNSILAQLDNNLRKISHIKKNIQDSTVIKSKDTIFKPKDSLTTRKDTLVKSTLVDELYHYAEDYTEINQRKKFIKLYNKAHIKYQDIDLTAGVIYVDYDKKEVYAGRVPDSLGNLTQRPVFKQGNTETENDSIRFNFKTKKALVWNTYTKEGEFSMHSSVTKKYNDSVIFVKNIKITTSTDKEHPEYYFLSKKAKIVPGKKIVIGPTQMWIEDVATPLVIPFGFFPLTETRTSGFLMPTFADSNRGYALTGGGFYWAINPYIDLITTGDIYTNGSYGLHLSSRYVKRYKFSGKFGFKYINTIQSEIPYVKNSEWRINWSHLNDAKSSPLSSFTAKVDVGSRKYYQDSYSYTDILNTNNRLSNEFGSSVSFQQRIPDLRLNFSVNLNHHQNVSTGKISMTLPQFNLSVSRIQPFAKKGMANNAFQRINFTYTLDAQQKINTVDSLFFKPQMWRDAEAGAMHTIPISTNMKLFKYFNLQPSLTYKEVWVMQSVRKQWNLSANNGHGGERIIRRNGYATFRDINGSLNLSTTVYGTYLFNKEHFLQGIRHTLNISFNASYHPINDKYIRKYYNWTKNKYVNYSIFDNGLYGKPNINESKSVTMSLSNDFEAKIKTKDGKSKKIRFLTASTGYNFLTDSISKITLHSTATISQGFTVNMSALYDYYALDTNGNNTKQFAWNNHQGIGRIQNFNLSTGYNFSNATFAKKNDQSDKKDNKTNKTKSAELYYNNIKWTMGVNYSFNYQNKSYQPNNLRFNEIATHSINFNGKIDFSPSWSITYNTGYDLVKKDFTFTQFKFHKDLKSWQMSLIWNPMSPYWFFNIGIKSSVLQGLKYDKRREDLQKFF